jgi:5-methylcytosine-specific restriction enzyme subunit McrC
VKIPILNLYYLVSYASGILSPDTRRIPVGEDDGYDLSDLYARLLIDGVDALLRRGLHRQYVGMEEEIPGIRGQLRFADSIRRDSFRHGRAVCSFDELDADILPNRILKAAMRRVLASRTLDRKLANDLRKTLLRMHGVRDVPLTAAAFRTLVVHRNMARYRFLLFVSGLVLEHSVVNEEGGTATFLDLVRDKAAMNRLFEAFVRNFYAREVPGFRAGRTQLTWSFAEDESSGLFPVMKTDVPLESANRILIIDTKFYANALALNAHEQDRLRSGHLYQMYAYMRHYPNPEGKPITGILLYPRTDRDLDVSAISTQNRQDRIRFQTLDLARPWPQIHAELLGLLKA